MINTKLIDKHIETLNEVELHEYMKVTAQNVSRLAKQKEKAILSEINESSNCSRSKRTTLVSKSYNITNAYNRELEILKYVISSI